MPVQSKAKFNGSGLKSRIKGLRFDVDWGYTSLYGLLGLLGLSIATGIVGMVSEISMENELEGANTFVLDDKTYELVDENSIKETNDSLSTEYNFEARVVDIREHNEDGETIERTMIRFEDSGAPDNIETARKAGVKIADQLQVAFKDARDRWFVNDEELRQDLIDDAQKFKAQYSVVKIVPTPSPNGGQ